MNTFRPGPVLRLIATALIFPLLFSTCKKNEDDPPDDPDVILSEATEVISNADWSQYLIGIDSTGDWEIAMNPAIKEKYDLQVGDIIVSAEGEGLLRKVTSIKEEAGELILVTTQAAMTEALEKASFDFQKNLTAEFKSARYKFFHEGIRPDTASREGENANIAFELELPIHEAITVTGKLSIDPSISGEVTIEDYSLIYMKMEFALEESFSLTTTAELASYSIEKEIKLVQISFPTFTVLAGGFPVVVTPEFILYLGANLELQSELTVGVTQELNVVAGLEYNNNSWTPYYEVEKDLGRTGPSLDNNLEAKAYVKPQLNMKFYGMVAPYLAMELYGMVEAELNATPWWELYAGLKTSIGIQIKIFVIQIANFSATLFDWKILIADSEGAGNTSPVAVFSIEPSTGTTATNFVFDASASYDAEDPPEVLQVRWDFEGNGSWDTPFSNEKVSYHKYEAPDTYFPKLQVRDGYEAVDDSVSTLQVSVGENQPPEALFTINPPTGPDTQAFTFDASVSTDQEDPADLLLVRWDWENDGEWDTDWDMEKTAVHQYAVGDYRPLLEVKDTEGLTDTVSVPVHVFNGNPVSYITDPRDGKMYATVQIGDQWWFAQNLNYGTRIDGPNHMTNDGVFEKYCYQDDEYMCDIYGGLYQWREAMDWVLEEKVQGLCPPGWHIPNQSEYEALAVYLGGMDVAGGKLKEAGYAHWNEPNTGATNLSGFTALPGGQRIFSNGMFNWMGEMGVFWSSTEIVNTSMSSMGYRLENDKEPFYQFVDHWSGGHSIRCIKD